MKGQELLKRALAAAVSLCLTVPALAAPAESSDQALMAVTAKVKTTLGLSTEIYTDFQGHADEDVLLGKRWSLEWSGDGVGLSITADDNGKIYAYNAYRAVEDPAVALPSRGNGGRLDIPRLPQDQSVAAFETARAFLNKVLESPVETVELDNDYRPSLNQDTYRYYGTVLLNGLESPISCHVTVRASDLTVLRFDRGDEYSGYLGSVPGKDTQVTEAQARSLLRSTYDMEAKYVLQEDGKTARVQYVPLSRDDYYVDGATGELVNLTELRKGLLTGGAGGSSTNGMLRDEAAPAEKDAAAGLTQAEKDGAAILKNALSKEELDKALKSAWPEIGLETYTLASANYSIREKKLEEGAARTSEDYEITCRLTYGKQVGSVTANKYVSADAKTGKLLSLRSSRYDRTYYLDRMPTEEEQVKWSISTPASTAQATAEPFLRSFIGSEIYDKLGLFSSDAATPDGDWEHTFTFQQTNAGYFYEGNAYTVGVDGTDGTISYVSGSFDPEVELVTPKSVVTKAQAIGAYEAALALQYAYLEVPVSISLAGPELTPLLKDAGYTYVTTLKTGFALIQPEDQYVRGVDAESGEAVVSEYTHGEETTMTYDDLDGHWVQDAAQALAVFRVGFYGGSFRPAQTLTQRDMIALLLSVEGFEFDPTKADQDAIDWLYQRAYTYGLVTPETRGDDKVITRGELVKVLLDSAGYQKIAALPGIFRCDYADAAFIPAGELGYAALAQGLGLVKGGTDGAYAPARPITRAEAVGMLYQYMK